MKKILTTLICTCQLFLLNCLAQPNAIPYQGVARNSSGNLLVNQNISLRFSIHSGSSGGTVVYQETHNVTTNNLGLFVANIGQGTPSGAIFSTVNWASGDKYTQVEMDPAGGTAFIDMGTSQMLSVPYALYALTSGSGSGGSANVSGTVNYVGKITPDGNSIGNSQIFDNGSNVGIGSTSGFVGKFNVYTSDATAINGQSTTLNGTGVMGKCNVGTDAFGIYGESSTGYAGYFNGKVRVNDKLGIGIVPTHPMNFANVVGDKVSFFGSSGPHYGIGIQGGLFQIHSNVLGSDIAFGYGESSAMTTNVTFKGNGNVGIGTNSPQEKLEVTGNVVSSGNLSGFRFSDRSLGYSKAYQWYAYDGNAYLYDHNTGTNRLTIDHSGFMGIGSSSPQTMLDVNGTVKANSLALTTGAGANKILKSDAFGNATWSAQASMPSGTTAGEMLYWDGNNWLIVPTGTTGQTLTYCNGTPHWGPCGNLASVYTTAVSSITTSSATSGGTITTDGGTAVTARGVCWSSTFNPTIANSHSSDGSGTGAYSSNLTGLSLGGYYVRAYAINGAGIAYGESVYFAASNFLVGQNYQGGTIVYVDATGLHGLIAANSDQSSGIQWSSGTDINISTSSSIGSGNSNTNAITAAQGTGFAADLCSNLVLGGYDDWYLPSTDELMQAGSVLTDGGGYWASVSLYQTIGFNHYYVYASTVTVSSGTCSSGADYRDQPHAVRAFRSF